MYLEYFVPYLWKCYRRRPLCGEFPYTTVQLSYALWHLRFGETFCLSFGVEDVSNMFLRNIGNYPLGLEKCMYGNDVMCR